MGGTEERQEKNKIKSALADSETSPVGKARGAEIIGSVMAQRVWHLDREECIFALCICCLYS